MNNWEKKELITDYDVRLQINRVWHLIPFFILEDFYQEISSTSPVVAKQLRSWLDNSGKRSVFTLEILLTPYASSLKSFILY